MWLMMIKPQLCKLCMSCKDQIVDLSLASLGVLHHDTSWSQILESDISVKPSERC